MSTFLFIAFFVLGYLYAPNIEKMLEKQKAKKILKKFNNLKKKGLTNNQASQKLGYSYDVIRGLKGKYKKYIN